MAEQLGGWTEVLRLTKIRQPRIYSLLYRVALTQIYVESVLRVMLVLYVLGHYAFDTDNVNAWRIKCY